MKKLALILGLLLIATPLMAQEFDVNISRKPIIKKQMAGLQIDNINKVAVVTINMLDEDGTIIQREQVVFQNIEEVTQVQKTGELYVYNVSIEGDNQQIESEVELTEYELDGETYEVEFDSMKPKMEEVVVQEASPQYNQFMNQIDIDGTGLRNAIRIKLGL